MSSINTVSENDSETIGLTPEKIKIFKELIEKHIIRKNIKHLKNENK